MIKSLLIEQNIDEPCMYKKCKQSVVMFLILYIDDILLIENDVRALSTVKIWFPSHFDMKNMGKNNYILGIKLLWDHKNKMLGLSQATYIDNSLVKFAMHNSKKESWPFRHGVPLSKE